MSRDQYQQSSDLRTRVYNTTFFLEKRVKDPEGYGIPPHIQLQITATYRHIDRKTHMTEHVYVDDSRV
ncbi:hypothetical protein E4U17_007417 [Claviceps sp. LM77 group G4]|nr:hypothetical protein E4U17_007417 [Claviceps sp. LM77 group G4]